MKTQLELTQCNVPPTKQTISAVKNVTWAFSKYQQRAVIDFLLVLLCPEAHLWDISAVSAIGLEGLKAQRKVITHLLPFHAKK